MLGDGMLGDGMHIHDIVHVHRTMPLQPMLFIYTFCLSHPLPHSCALIIMQGRGCRWTTFRKIFLVCFLALCFVFYSKYKGTKQNTSSVHPVVTSELSGEHTPTEFSHTSEFIDAGLPSDSESGKKITVTHETTADSEQSAPVEHRQTETSETGKDVEGSPKAVLIKPPSGQLSESKRTFHNCHSSGSPCVLLLCSTDADKLSVEVIKFLEAHHIHFIHTNVSKFRLDADSDEGADLLLVIIVASIAQYQSSNVQQCLDYCRSRNLPIIWVVLPTTSQPELTLPNLDTASLDSGSIVHVALSKSYPFYYGRPGASTASVPSNTQWITFTVKQSSNGQLTGQNLNSNSAAVSGTDIQGADNYETLVYIASGTEPPSPGHNLASGIIEDFGEFDGVKKVIIGTPLQFWLTHLVMLDALHVLCEGLVRGGRERLVMVDIDDIFWSPEGRKMKADDVQVLMDLYTCTYMYVC